MPPQPIKREFAFTIMDVARLLKTYADQRARQFGISRAQWAVLVRIDRNEGLKQTELADLLDLQPITLTRLLDRLSDSGLIERRADPNDRRANRLYLKPAAKPLLDRLANLGAEMMEVVLDGVSMASIERTLKELGTVKDNLRTAIARNTNQQQAVAAEIMSEKPLKIVPAPASKTSPEAKTETSCSKGLFARSGRKRLRTI